MEKIICDACGSTEMTKKENYFICDYCNTSYRAEQEPEQNISHTKSYCNTTTINIMNTTTTNYTERKVPLQIQKADSSPNLVVKILQKMLGSLLLFAGFIFFLAIFSTFYQNGIAGGLIFAWLSLLLGNSGWTKVTGKKVLLNARFSGKQITFISIAIIVSLLFFV